MVSIVLLTTEEVLKRNVFWHSLDSIWDTEEMEPFEEVKFEHMFTKPLSRDFYYAKYPDIPRSESDEENSLSLNGFKIKHQEWKSNICIKRINAQHRHSNQSYLSCSASKNETKRVSSLVQNRSQNEYLNGKRQEFKNNDERVLDFLKRLQENVPPPPIEDLQHSRDISTGSIEYPKQVIDLNDVELPDYNDFANNKIKQIELREDNALPTTSTLKKSKKVSFSLKHSKSEFGSDESWYDSIYGVSLWTPDNDIMQEVDLNPIDNMDDASASDDNYPSWSEILKECDVYEEELLHNEELLLSSEEVISCSNRDAELCNLDFEEANNEEAGYARFAIYKIHQTLKIKGDAMLDSSSMIDLSAVEDHVFNKTARDSSFFGTVYRLVPNSIEDIRE